MLSVLTMFRRMLGAMKYAAKEEHFGVVGEPLSRRAILSVRVLIA